MKRYIKSNSYESKLNDFRQEARLCRFMRDNYGLSCSISNMNRVCNLWTEDRGACVCASPEYSQIAIKEEHYSQDTSRPSTFITLYIPYDLPLNDDTAEQVIDYLTFTDNDKDYYDDF